MSKWTIYDKNGNARRANVSGTGDGEAVIVGVLEYHGTFMGECYVTVSVKSAYPIDFQIGDYVTYRGEKFVLATDPAVVKKARRGSYGEGFEYKDIKFSSLSMELTDIRFLDCVLADNLLHYTNLPDFPFYASSVEDYADRLQANTNRYCTDNGFPLADYWLFLTPDMERFITRASMLVKVNGSWTGLTRQQATTIWNEAYPNGASMENAKENVNMSVSSQNIWESLTHIKDDFGLNFTTRGRKVIIGAAGIATDHIFEYGKGNGLYEMERQVDSEQQIITKLYAYGSDKNMPVRYYANIQKNYYDYVVDYKCYNTDDDAYKILEISFDTLYRSNMFSSRKIANISANGASLHVSILNDVTTGKLSVFAKAPLTNEYNDEEGLVTLAQLNAFVENLNSGDKIYFTKYINEKEWPKTKIGYSNIVITPYSSVSNVVTKQHTEGESVVLSFDLTTDYSMDYFVAASLLSPSFPAYPDDKNFIVSMVANGKKASGLLSHGDNGKCHIAVTWTAGGAEDFMMHSEEATMAFYNEIVNGVQIIFAGGANENTFPTVDSSYTETDLPNNMSVNKLMLPGFPTMSLYQWVKTHGGTNCNDETGEATWHGYTAIFSKDKFAPYIISPNFVTLGMKEGSKNFDGSDDTDEIYPSLEDTGYDIIQHADVIEDNGLFDEGSDKPTFKILVPYLEELDQLINDNTEEGGSPTISMKTGFCAGREFPIKVNSIKEDDGKWAIECEREYDNAIELYFPYSYNASIGQRPTANELYQIRGADVDNYDGDKFVFTGIPMSTEYINMASIKLLEKALEYLFANNYTRFTFLPKVDELFMAREHEAATLAGTESLHDIIKEGNLLAFKDDDLLIPNSEIFIDTLIIKEPGNANIPTYEVTLRNDKSVSQLQRMQNQIDSISSVARTASRAAMAPSRQSEQNFDDRYLSKTDNDVAQGAILIKGGVTVGDGEHGMDEDGNVTANEVNAEKVEAQEAVVDKIQSHNFEHGADTGRGWGVDENGNAEFESAVIRSFLEVLELLVNRMQAQEGDTIFTDNDQIESVTRREVNGQVTYILDLKEKWDGYVTPQKYGNILKGIINTLAAKEAGISDKTGDYTGQSEDAGGNKYYTSWMHVVNTHNTDPTLGINQIEVVMYGDNDVPAARNFEPCAMMVLARRGCIDYSNHSDPDYQTVKADIIRRQRFFEISASDGRVVKFTGVDHPKLANGNYGVSIGELPDFVKRYAKVQEILSQVGEHTDWLYAQGVVVGNYIKVNVEGLPVPDVVDCGDWIDGNRTEPLTIQVWDAQRGQYVDHVLTFPIPSTEYDNPNSLYIGHGIYFNNKYNGLTQRYETHKARHSNGTWFCLQNEPVISGGVATYNEPHWNSAYWRLTDGNGNYSIEFVSSRGFSFRRGYVDTDITPHLFYGNVDITDDVDAQYWNWTRESESGKTDADRYWDAQHTGLITGVKTLHLTNEDMPLNWSSADKAIFTCSVTINDGKTTIIVDNQIIS